MFCKEHQLCISSFCFSQIWSLQQKMYCIFSTCPEYPVEEMSYIHYLDKGKFQSFP